MHTQRSLSPRFWLFLIATFLISWAVWIPVALSGQPATGTPQNAILYLIGGFGPSVVGLVLMLVRDRRSQDPEAVRARAELGRRAWSFRRLSALTWLAILLIPVTMLVGIGLDLALGGTYVIPPALQQALQQPALLIGTLIIGILAGPISEEFGWRGYALDLLVDRWSPLVATLVLALAWWFWHLPLFFIVGTTQHSWGLGSLPFWLFLINVFSLSLIFSWAYYHSRRSILAAILLHFAYNFTLALIFPLPVGAQVWQAVLLGLVGIWAGWQLWSRRTAA